MGKRKRGSNEAEKKIFFCIGNTAQKNEPNASEYDMFPWILMILTHCRSVFAMYKDFAPEAAVFLDRRKNVGYNK